MLLEAEINPPGGRQQRTGSNSSAYPSMRFTENNIDVSVLRHLPDQDLKDIGVPPGASAEDARGHQRAYRRGPATPEPAARMEPKTQDTAERRQLMVMSTDVVGSRRGSIPRDLRAIMTARCYRLGSGLARLLRPHRIAAEDVSSLCAEFGRREPKRQSGPVER